jgi:hypothetical protein
MADSLLLPGWTIGVIVTPEDDTQITIIVPLEKIDVAD